MQMKTRVDQVMVDPDPMKTGEKIEAVVDCRYAEGWHLRAIAPQAVLPQTLRRPGGDVTATQVMHLVFVKEAR